MEGWGQLRDVNDVEYIHWTIASSAIKNWEASPQIGRVIELTDQDVTSQYLSYYYVASGLKLPTVSAELFSPTTSDEGSRAPLGTINLQVKLQVSKPSNSFTGTQGPISIQPIGNVPWLIHAGVEADGTKVQGMTYTVNDPNNTMNGSFRFVQVVNSSNKTIRGKTDVAVNQIGEAGSVVDQIQYIRAVDGKQPPALDSNGTQYPSYLYDIQKFSENKLISMSDSPGIALIRQGVFSSLDFPGGVSCHVTSYSTQSTFTTYLMWKPDIPQSIYVPVSSANWSWSASAAWDDALSQWNVTSASSTASSSQTQTRHPEWVQTVRQRFNEQAELKIIEAK